MQNINRNVFLDDTWILRKVESNTICASFDCGDSDLNEYFQVDAIQYKEELLTQTYYLYESTHPDLVLALLDFCNDSIRLEKYKHVIDIDENKQHQSLPAVKLTRFGVQRGFQGKNIGTHALNMVKKLFMTDNRTGCRLITVDAYNNPRVIKFYGKNEFKPFNDKDKNKATRALFFDLKRLITSI